MSEIGDDADSINELVLLVFGMAVYCKERGKWSSTPIRNHRRDFEAVRYFGSKTRLGLHSDVSATRQLANDWRSCNV